MEEYVQAALKAGLQEIGFSDHIPMYFRRPDPGYAMTETQLDEYVAEVARLGKQYPGITILTALECDYDRRHEAGLVRILKYFPWDYTLGSIHFVGDWGFDDPRRIEGYQQWNLAHLYREYFSLVQAAAKSGFFQVMSHTDLIKKLGFRSTEDLSDIYEETARVYRDAGVAAEVNTAGWRAPIGEIYPHPDFLERCHHYRVPVTLGSDAHQPEQVGYRLPDAVRLLRDIGYKEAASFRRRRMRLVPLEDL